MVEVATGVEAKAGQVHKAADDALKLAALGACGQADRCVLLVTSPALHAKLSGDGAWRATAFARFEVGLMLVDPGSELATRLTHAARTQGARFRQVE